MVCYTISWSARNRSNLNGKLHPFFIKRQPWTCFKMESPIITVFFLGAFMDFEFFQGSLCGVVLLSFNFLLLLLFAIACKFSFQVCEPEGLGFYIICWINSAIMCFFRRVLYVSLVLDKLCVDKVDGIYWFSPFASIIWFLVKFSFL